MFSFRNATKNDCALILEFIKGLAQYENLLDEVIATEESLYQGLFEKEKAEVIFVMEGEVEAGLAIFFHNFSTFVGCAGIYIEDLYVKPQFRGRGYGKALLSRVAQIAVERDCARLDWCCLNWNKPSIDFYRSLGAKAVDEWTNYRIAGDKLNTLANM